MVRRSATRMAGGGTIASKGFFCKGASLALVLAHVGAGEASSEPRTADCRYSCLAVASMARPATGARPATITGQRIGRYAKLSPLLIRTALFSILRVRVPKNGKLKARDRRRAARRSRLADQAHLGDLGLLLECLDKA